MALTIWKQISTNEVTRVKKLLNQSMNAKVSREWVSAYVFGCRRFLEGVLTALKPTMNESEIAQAESEFDILVGDLDKISSNEFRIQG